MRGIRVIVMPLAVLGAPPIPSRSAWVAAVMVMTPAPFVAIVCTYLVTGPAPAVSLQPQSLPAGVKLAGALW